MPLLVYFDGSVYVGQYVKPRNTPNCHQWPVITEIPQPPHNPTTTRRGKYGEYGLAIAHRSETSTLSLVAWAPSRLQSRHISDTFRSQLAVDHRQRTFNFST